MFQALQIIFKVNKQQIRIYTRRNLLFKVNKQQIRIYTRRNLLKQFGMIDPNLQ
jgi:DNA-binding transcriptional MerR regulator